MITDPPYGYSFMNKDWDKAVISVDTWKECLRVLKPGAFAFIMSSPRQDVLSRMVCNLQDAGFETNFTSIYWTYASGFPKAADVSKLVDKRKDRNPVMDKSIAIYLKQKRIEKSLSTKDINEMLNTNMTYEHYERTDNSGHIIPIKQHYLKLKEILDLDSRFDDLIDREEAEREIIAKSVKGVGSVSNSGIYEINNIKTSKMQRCYDITRPATDEAKKLDGSYCGFQPKPAVEVILVVMKPLSEKSFTDQALANGKGITWLDDCRIPYQSEQDSQQINQEFKKATPSNTDVYNWNQTQGETGQRCLANQQGRFPANLLVSDDALNDGRILKSGDHHSHIELSNNLYQHGTIKKGAINTHNNRGDSGSYSRYFDLDKWFDTTFPFLITPKASKSEKNAGLIDSYFEPQTVDDGRNKPIDNAFQRGKTQRLNIHPTVKPIKLMSYLIMLGSRENDTVLDPFCGSGTTCIAAKMLERNYIGIEINKEYIAIAEARLNCCNNKNGKL